MRTHLQGWLPPLAVLAIIGTLWGAFFWARTRPDPAWAGEQRRARACHVLKDGMTEGQVQRLMGVPDKVLPYPATEGMGERDEWDYYGCASVTFYYEEVSPPVSQVDPY